MLVGFGDLLSLHCRTLIIPLGSRECETPRETEGVTRSYRDDSDTVYKLVMDLCS